MRERNRKNTQIDAIQFYLFVSLRNRITKSFKKSNLISFFRGVQPPENAFEFEEAHDVKIINKQLSKENSEKLLIALNKLTVKQREGVTYFFYDGMTYEQVAVLMNLKSAKYARKLIYRALNSLRQHF